MQNDKIVMAGLNPAHTAKRIETSLQKAAGIIREGGVVAFPTETVYGLGANAFDEKAAARVFEIKRRPHFDPLIVHISEKERLDELVTDVPPLAQKLIDVFWPGPLTVVLPKKSAVPDIITSGLPGVGIRMPSNDIARQLIGLAGVPVAAPSANLFGGVSPTTAEHVRESLGASVDMIIDGGECTVGIESTVISFMVDVDGGTPPMLLRPGGVTLEEIEGVIGKVVIPGRGEYVSQSPGRCEQHYATVVPIVLVGDVGDVDVNGNIGLLALSPDSVLKNKSQNQNQCQLQSQNIIMGTGDTPVTPLLKPIHAKTRILKQNTGVNVISNQYTDANQQVELPSYIKKVEYLSSSGDLREAACNLFAAMRRLDAAGVDMIAVLPIPDVGLGLAINDRLYRASRKR